MLWLPTDRTGWLVLLLAVVNLAVHCTVMTLVVVHKPTVLPKVWMDLVLMQLPAVLILVAAGLCVRGRSPARYAVAVAGLIAVVGETCVLDGWVGSPVASVVGPAVTQTARKWLANPPWTHLIALAALVPAVVYRCLWGRPATPADD